MGPKGTSGRLGRIGQRVSAGFAEVAGLHEFVMVQGMAGEKGSKGETGEQGLDGMPGDMVSSQQTTPRRKSLNSFIHFNSSIRM